MNRVIIVSVVVGTVLLLTCFVCMCLYRKRRTRKRRTCSTIRYSVPNDAITAPRTSTYSTPYDKRLSTDGVLTVKHISSKSGTKSHKNCVKIPASFDVSVTDYVQKDHDVVNKQNFENEKKRKPSARRSVVYNNVDKQYMGDKNTNFKDSLRPQKEFESQEKQITTKGNIYTQVNNQTNNINRKCSARKDLPAPYSCINIDF